MTETLQLLQSIVGLLSVIVAIFIGGFMALQYFSDPQRKSVYFLFALTWWSLSLFDIAFMSQEIDHKHYELCRLFWGAGYTLSILTLYQASIRLRFFIPLSILVAGVSVWTNNWVYATTTSFPLYFFVGAWFHGRQFIKSQGYASAFLCISTILLLSLCSTYQLHLSKSPGILLYGYLHYATVSIMSLLLGWIHFPRELRNQAPVTITRKIFNTVLIAAILGNALYLSGVIFNSKVNVYMHLGFLIEVTALITLFFHQRHLLVIHAANITELLEERTQSLVQAKNELSEANKKLENKIIQNQLDLENKSAVIERQKRLELAAQTAGEAAHDIQNSIAPLFNYARELDRNSGNHSLVKEMAIKIRNQIEGLSDLNSQILALSRRGRMDLNPIEISDVFSSVSDHFIGSDLKFTMDKKLWVQGSWTQLHRALLNLVINAYDASYSQKAVVNVTAEAVTIDEAKSCCCGIISSGQWVRIQVIDQGCGIPDEIISDIFKPFYSSKVKGVQSGSGLD